MNDGGGSGDLRVAVQAVLLPLGTGIALLDGYLLLGWFGVVLAVIGSYTFGHWWRGKYGELLPRHAPTTSVAKAGGLVGALLLLFLVLS